MSRYQEEVAGVRVIATKAGIEYYRLASVKYQLKMEALGMRSSGGALRPRLAVEFGLKARDSREAYIEVCKEKMAALVVKVESNRQG